MRLSFLCRRSGVTQFNKVYKLLVIFLHLVSFEMNDEFQGRRALRGKSDPTSLHCQCNNNGLVLLFYKYILVTNVKSLAQQLKINSLSLTGKIRIGVEGFNVTVAGSISHINTFIAFMRSTEYLNENQTKEQDVTFFKPSPGCIHG